ncbi:MAG: hypothetical protein FWC92_09000 [Defluviitaleaceae bacterium]|nr:hypothetical protein [Defluviitaleaceae bacterium]
MKSYRTDKKKTERLIHRNSPERLLACLESIDDEFITEAALAVNYDKHKPPRWQWLNLGNAAAVFIGAVAVTCVLLLSFRLTRPELSEIPMVSYEHNGEYPSYDIPYNLPGELVPGGMLPLPTIHASGFEVILPRDMPHMTTNNPWHDIGHIETLPVFRSHMITHFTAYQADYDIQLSAEDNAIFLDMIQEKGLAMAAAANISPDRVSPDLLNDGTFVATIIDGYRSIASKQMGTLTLRTHLSEVYNDRIALPQGASISYFANEAEAQAAIEYLARRLEGVLPMQVPTMSTHGVHDLGAPSLYHRRMFFDAGGSPQDAILSFNFKWIEILSIDPHHAERIEVALFPHEHLESLQLGHYPIITADEAREMLLEGYFVSHFPNNMWPGIERMQEASVELVYHLPMFNSEMEVIMPFYRFLVEVDIPTWWVSNLEAANIESDGFKAFARYYVPAVHRDFLEPMTRRSITQLTNPPQAPTGPRALPQDVFETIYMLDGNFWRPWQVERHEVAVLWDEIINEIGGLAVNQSYQFRTACGHYAMITGNRTMTSRDELHRYFPGHDLSETVGDFTLREISVFDQTRDLMFISSSPMASFESILMFSDGEPTPVDEISAREPLAYSIFAMYENFEGVQVGLGLLPHIGLHSLAESGDPHSVLDMGEYGIIHFHGNPGEYFRALHEPTYPQPGWGTIELWFINDSIDTRRFAWDLGYGIWHGSPDMFTGTHWFTPVERDALEGLVRVFNPASLVAVYGDELMLLQ